MPELTFGQFESALGSVVDSLNALADDVSTCNLDTEVDNTQGRTVICQIPKVGGADCRLRTRDNLRVSDLYEAITALSQWAADIKATVAGHTNPNDPIFAPFTDPRPEELDDNA
jgi:predicted transcriptional regulator